MPAKWKRMAMHIKESEMAKGVSEKVASSIGYGAATKSWEKHHGGQSPQASAGEKHSKKEKAVKDQLRRMY